MRLRIFGILFLLIAGSAWAATQEGRAGSQQQVIYLVRHAEKRVDAGVEDKDPPLTDTGDARAQHLAYVLGDIGIDHIYTSDYRRTRQTGEPLAKKLGLNMQPYDPRALPAFAQQLQQLGGRILVVGHSNTTPQLVELLGGDGGAPIDEASEYDRLYILIRDGDRVTTLLQRFGSSGRRPQD
ncbi:Phosphohistidine phosphatase SixA [Microbulbifer donghaiensis]|uniref:Phosphohistidine phosphatase SixA n=1 Tax=Microbulbifer donghaiensis TaxID=494016 RepID=A0A1M4ZPE3_9GAMM|nr:phosphoglycerate mutase family protein [Microbulbifer donghaiensis]SHF19874.1 Phosphohistidine phosphatase SixA [Microbulbifer donghaiensis]